MKRTIISLILLAAFCAAPVLAKEPKRVSTLVGSLSYQELDKVKSGTGAFDLTFPVGHHFSIGPMVDYTYVKVENANDPASIGLTVAATPPPDYCPVGVSREDISLPPAIVPSNGGDDTLSVLSFGLRTALYPMKGHNGLVFSLEALLPQHDAEGYILTPGVGFEAGIGTKGIFRAEWQHPLSYSNGDLLDLEGWRVSAGFGRRF